MRRVKGFADLKATEQLAAEHERKAERLRSGYSDPAEEQIRRPLAEHLKDYAAVQEAKGGTTDHVRQTAARVAALLAGCGFVYPLDADAGKAAEWLNALRRDVVPPALPPGDIRAGRSGEAAGCQWGRRSGERKAARLDRDRQRQGPELPPRHR